MTMDDPIPAPLRRRGTKHPYRRRARIACVCCHDRKVRCDVAVNGTPCTNCRLDRNTCTIKDRGTKPHDTVPSRRVALTKADSVISDQKTSFHEDHDVFESMLTDLTNEDPRGNPPVQDIVASSRASEMDDLFSRSLDPLLSSNALNSNHTKPSFPVLSETFPRSISQPLFDDMQFNISNEFASSSTSFTSDFSHVPYTYYPFLRLEPISHLPAEDVNFLEHKRCFHVPCRPIVDEFVAKYFLHIHPALPHILESEFWHMYFGSSNKPPTELSSRLSLFVFQCMLFAGCSFVPISTLQKCGFSSIRDARAGFYRRAKLLFDFNIEHDPYSTSCGALLLTMFVSEQQHQVNTTWLSAAIMHAKAANAHLYSHDPYILEPERRKKKILWWSCILMDRIIALGLRRPLQITPEQFDITQPCLEEEDFHEEFKRSKVYDETTKLKMVGYLIMLCKLAVVLTQTINTVYPQNGFSRFTTQIVDSPEELSGAETKVQKAKKDLEAWFLQAKKTQEKDSHGGTMKANENVMLYRNIIFIYYYGAKSALAHHEALLIETYLSRSTVIHDLRLRTVAHELQDTSNAISKLLKEIMGLTIAQNIPISAVAYIAFPLVLNTIDLKLSPPNAPMCPKKQQLDFYSEAMRICEARYEGTKKLAMIVKKLVTFAAHESRKLVTQSSGNPPSTSSLEDGSEIKDWLGVLVKHPKLYLKVSLSLDLSMARGKYPNQQDMPENLLWIGPENDLMTGARLLSMDASASLAGDICKPRWTASSMPRSLGNISMEFTFTPKSRGKQLPAREGKGYEVNLDFMEINVEDVGDKVVESTNHGRDNWADDMVDWSVEGASTME